MKKGDTIKNLRKLRYWEVQNKRLFEAIKATGLALSECAKAVGVSLRTLERWIFQGSTPKPWNQAKAAQVLKKQPDELF